jgi:hypothetical protein
MVKLIGQQYLRMRKPFPCIKRETMLPQGSNPVGTFIIIQRDGSSFSRREILIGIKTEAREVPGSSYVPAIHKPAAESMRSIFYDLDADWNDLPNGLYIHSQTAKMHDDDGLRFSRKLFSYGLRRHAPCLDINVGKHGNGAKVDCGIGGATPRHTRADHFIAGSHTRHEEREE